MKYYADGMRATKETASVTNTYVYNLAGKLIAESKMLNTPNASKDITTNYVWGPDRALVKKDVGGGEYYYLYNGHGDVIQMVDRNGNVVNNYSYDEWGNRSVTNILAGESEIGKFETAAKNGVTAVNVVNPQTGKNTRAIRLNAGSTVPVTSIWGMNLKANKKYVLEFDYWSDADNVTFDCDLYPDDLPQIIPTAKKSIQHYKWEFDSSSGNMSNVAIRFFNDTVITNPANIYITNITLYENDEIDNPFGYAGEVFDQETGLYYLRARYYDPSMGRFINEDTFEGQIINPLSLNVYTYCSNNPLIYVDPSGHKHIVSDYTYSYYEQVPWEDTSDGLEGYDYIKRYMTVRKHEFTNINLVVYENIEGTGEFHWSCNGAANNYTAKFITTDGDEYKSIDDLVELDYDHRFDKTWRIVKAGVNAFSDVFAFVKLGKAAVTATYLDDMGKPLMNFILPGSDDFIITSIDYAVVKQKPDYTWITGLIPIYGTYQAVGEINNQKTIEGIFVLVKKGEDIY